MSEEVKQEAKKTTYWKSLNELAKNEKYEKYVSGEFEADDPSKLGEDEKDGVTRKSFLQIMGASVALAGFASCRRPVQKLLPYSNAPEDIIPGESLYYASAVPFQDALTGLVVVTTDARPIKIEGNELHPASLGNTSIFQQGELLSMYDPDRSQRVREHGENSSYTLFQSYCKQHFDENTDQNIAFISEPNSSPTYNRLKQQALDRFPNAQWVTYAPFGEDNTFEGTRIAFGERLRPLYHYEEAEVMVALDDDFMNPAANKNSVRNALMWAKTRKLESPEDEMSRLYSIESTYTLTGTNADSRLRIKSSEMPAFVYALASKLSESVSGLQAFSGVENKFTDTEWVNEVSNDLLQHRGESVISLCDEHVPELHAAVAAMNAALGNAGSTVTYHRVPHIDQQYNKDIFADLVRQMKNDEIDTVVIIGSNPVFTAPADLAFDEAINSVDEVLHLSDYYGETSKHARWHVNKAHFLETWMDGYSFAGVGSVIQPTIRPLFDGKSPIEFLYTIVTGEEGDEYELIRDTWRDKIEGNFELSWDRMLHDGLYKTEPFPEVTPTVAEGFEGRIEEAIENYEIREGLELVIRPSSTIYDGRYSNNAWLQELPDPVNKITWDNVALMSPNTAEKLGVEKPGLGTAYMDLLEITVEGRTVEIPAWIQPGHADDSITVTVGYGRHEIGKVAYATGVDTYPLRTSKTLLYATDIEVSNTGEPYAVACTQDHHSMEGRELMKHATLQEYRDHPDFAHFYEEKTAEMPGQSYDDQEPTEGPLSIFNPLYQEDYPDYQPQWGMAIDLNTCIGCGACTIACQAENNIPIVGKERVAGGREMHWIRTDRYYAGDKDNPAALHQPVPCMHCELAPCEQVCPVAATTHSADGMNQMTYNRCIGTRYCSNNCPYKVRRFNFFNYSQEFLTRGDDPEIIQMAMNPEVTVRFRGVMEKCTYCVQRVNAAKIKTEIATDGETIKPPDGSVQTACQQACPADAFAFGDLTDTDSEVYQTKLSNRNYLMLAELNTRPRTSYLAKITNPNLALAEHATAT